MNAVQPRDEFQRRQDARSIAVLGLIHFAGEWIELLGEFQRVADGLKKSFADQRHFGIMAIVLQRSDGTLKSQSLRLAAPIVPGDIAKRRVVGSDGRKRHGRPELFRIEQMMADKGIGHLLVKTAEIHAAQVIVQKNIHHPVVFIQVIAGVPVLLPQALLQALSDCLRPALPVGFPAVAEQAGDSRQHLPAGVRVRKDVHGFDRQGVVMDFGCVFVADAKGEQFLLRDCGDVLSGGRKIERPCPR
ncbi:MAG: hypothetical protein BWY83_03160 [bacterium ADurb.Bin478]|nr:MAG: hypothetical protein BWY83_03160 [bacterium ADurb.Bin478]